MGSSLTSGHSQTALTTTEKIEQIIIRHAEARILEQERYADDEERMGQERHVGDSTDYI